ncbi:MAG: hypothetical protein K2P62_01820, partial [Phocaeicola sp.]|nr:hypothetical protein [Phocaeicola sp.]
GGRLTFYYEPHGTVSVGKAPNLGGDLQWYNNLLAERASFDRWDECTLPMKFEGNASADPASDLEVELIKKTDGWYLSMKAAGNWLQKEKRRLITTAVLGKTITSNQAFTHPDGSSLKISRDYQGMKRNAANPCPGPFEVSKTGKYEWKVWDIPFEVKNR